MNGIDLLVAIIKCATLIWVVRWITSAFRSELALARENRRLPAPPDWQENAEIPTDLLSLIVTAYHEPWAQDDAIKVAQESYQRYKNWDTVRQHMMIHLPQPEATDG